MMKCEACNDDKVVPALVKEFTDTDYEFCGDRLSSEETDTAKWEIIDKIINFCEQHQLEFLKNE